MKDQVKILTLVVLIATAWPVARRLQTPERFGFGRPATSADIARVDDDVAPDGRGLPLASGTVAQGDAIFKTRCAGCHGATGKEGPFDRLIGRMPGDSFAFGSDPSLLGLRTIGNYWPYATTLYDFIHRAMPFDRPGSLAPAEVYSVVAYLLYKNDIIAANAVMNERTLPRVVMPAHDRFVLDDRRGGREVR